MGDDPRASDATACERGRRIRELEARVEELEAQQRRRFLQAQSSTANEILKTLDAPSLFKLVAERIYSIAQGAIVAITEFDPRAGRVMVRRVECPPDDYPRIVAILGQDPVGLSLDLGEEARQRWKAGKLVRVPGGLHDLFFRQVPVAVCERLEEELALGEAFGMACASEDEILGSVAVVSRKGRRLSNQALVEQLVAQAALGLKRIRAEEARKETEERFRLLFDSTSDGVWIHSLDGVIREVNDAYCAMSGYSRSELEGMPVSRVETVESPRGIAQHIARLIRCGGHDRFESRHRRKDGSTFAVDITALYIDRGGGQVAIFVRDITERKRAEDELRQSERRYRELAARLKEADRHKDEFLAMLAHELRNPLAAIASAAQIFATPGVEASTIERAREAMERQSRHMARLVDDLLDVSRVTQGKVSLKRELLDVEAIVKGAVEIAAEAIDARRQHLFVSPVRQPLLLEGDGVRLTQALSNLLNNASKYTPEGGEIHLSVETRGGFALVTVRDNGDGIRRELLPRIFDLFVQGDRSADRRQGGLGIGLTMARLLVEMHGGRIKAHSAGPGKGSEFVISLPLAVPEARAGAATKAEDDPCKAVERVCVLVVDDNDDAAEMLRVLLELEGHEVLTAKSGREAIELAGQHTPQVALIDIGMPGMDGYEVARRLRGEPRLSGLVLAALTGYGQAEDVENSRNAGFDHHLVKPASLDALRDVLARRW